MAEQIERIGVGLVCCCPEFRKVNPPLLKTSNDVRALRGVSPFALKLSRCRIQRADGFRSVVSIPHYPKLLAVRVELVNEMRGDLDPATVEIKFSALVGRRLNDLGGRGLG